MNEQERDPAANRSDREGGSGARGGDRAMEKGNRNIREGAKLERNTSEQEHLDKEREMQNEMNRNKGKG